MAGKLKRPSAPVVRIRAPPMRAGDSMATLTPDQRTTTSPFGRKVVQTAVGMGIPALAISASLAYFDAYRSERLPANLTPRQRELFEQLRQEG